MSEFGLYTLGDYPVADDGKQYPLGMSLLGTTGGDTARAVQTASSVTLTGTGLEYAGDASWEDSGSGITLALTPAASMTNVFAYAGARGFSCSAVEVGSLRAFPTTSSDVSGVGNQAGSTVLVLAGTASVSFRTSTSTTSFGEAQTESWAASVDTVERAVVGAGELTILCASGLDGAQQKLLWRAYSGSFNSVNVATGTVPGIADGLVGCGYLPNGALVYHIGNGTSASMANSLASVGNMFVLGSQMVAIDFANQEYETFTVGAFTSDGAPTAMAALSSQFTGVTVIDDKAYVVAGNGDIHVWSGGSFSVHRTAGAVPFDGSGPSALVAASTSGDDYIFVLATRTVAGGIGAAVSVPGSTSWVEYTNLPTVGVTDMFPVTTSVGPGCHAVISVDGQLWTLPLDDASIRATEYGTPSPVVVDDLVYAPPVLDPVLLSDGSANALGNIDWGPVIPTTIRVSTSLDATLGPVPDGWAAAESTGGFTFTAGDGALATVGDLSVLVSKKGDVAISTISENNLGLADMDQFGNSTVTADGNTASAVIGTASEVTQAVAVGQGDLFVRVAGDNVLTATHTDGRVAWQANDGATIPITSDRPILAGGTATETLFLGRDGTEVSAYTGGVLASGEAGSESGIRATQYGSFAVAIREADSKCIVAPASLALLADAVSTVSISAQLTAHQSVASVTGDRVVVFGRDNLDTKYVVVWWDFQSHLFLTSDADAADMPGFETYDVVGDISVCSPAIMSSGMVATDTTMNTMLSGANGACYRLERGDAGYSVTEILDSTSFVPSGPQQFGRVGGMAYGTEEIAFVRQILGEDGETPTDEGEESETKRNARVATIALGAAFAVSLAVLVVMWLLAL